MKVSVHAEGTQAEVAKQLADHAALYVLTTMAKTARPAPGEAPLDEETFGELEEETFGESEEKELPPDEEETTIETVRTQAKAFLKKKGAPALAQKLSKFGVKALKELKSSKYDAFLLSLTK